MDPRSDARRPLNACFYCTTDRVISCDVNIYLLLILYAIKIKLLYTNNRLQFARICVIIVSGKRKPTEPRRGSTPPEHKDLRRPI